MCSGYYKIVYISSLCHCFWSDRNHPSGPRLGGIWDHPQTLGCCSKTRKQLEQIPAANCISSRFNWIVYSWNPQCHKGSTYHFSFLSWNNTGGACLRPERLHTILAPCALGRRCMPVWNEEEFPPKHSGIHTDTLLPLHAELWVCPQMFFWRTRPPNWCMLIRYHPRQHPSVSLRN